MKTLVILMAFVAIATGDDKFPKANCATNKFIKMASSIVGEAADKCAVVSNVVVTASSVIDADVYGNDQADLESGKGILTNNKENYPNTEELPKPTFTITLPSPAGVCGVVIGGRIDYDNDYVEKFAVEGTADDENWFKARTDDGGFEFEGNSKGSDVKAVFFATPVPANKIVLTATRIMDGAAAALRVAVIVNCEYKNTYDLGDTCEYSLSSASVFGAFDQIPMCKKLRMICRAGACTQLRPSWGADPFTFDSPICYNIQLEFSTLGDGNFACWKIGKWNKFGGLLRHDLESLRYNAEPDGGYDAYTCDFDKYLEVCKGKGKS